MSFAADKQTIEDLNLLGKYKPQSIYSIFNKVKTLGGERLLDAMFKHPLTDPDIINRRSDIFRYFREKDLVFPFQPAVCRIAEDYLSAVIPGNRIQATFSVFRKKALEAFLRDEQFAAIYSGLEATIEMLAKLAELLRQLDGKPGDPYYEQALQLKNILADPRLFWLSQEKGQQLSAMKVAKYDFILRHSLRHEMEKVLIGIYELDVYTTVGSVAAERHFSFAKALPASQNILRAVALRHPALEKAVGNPVSLHGDKNVLFLTGANMAGKSTFMKSLGIAVYLAHMGFPVAAQNMEFSIRDGVYSSINVADNLNMGYSHFYAEVLRVRQAAEEVSNGKNMVVIFDELFKGTNVKDAFDATLAVTSAFSKYLNCIFVISTHIIEVGEALQDHTNLQFSYLPTLMEGNVPRYPYILTAGITSDRHGMMIIQNEGILEMITGNNNTTTIVR
ncbi:MutS-related protein [Chitinophaga tropicalis]|uniref:DNA mismatch repair protein n=1 Tax=Chitinophaga tropicalis TaxID=2683588 RepID=A0A7K1U362_9BACT|nr:DNA mismatch repair protein [Chitinophaga tropicalis]MVT08804.1 DNA mismatch repair protein [Chitinophaga tropicalis]